MAQLNPGAVEARHVSTTHASVPATASTCLHHQSECTNTLMQLGTEANMLALPQGHIQVRSWESNLRHFLWSEVVCVASRRLDSTPVRALQLPAVRPRLLQVGALAHAWANVLLSNTLHGMTCAHSRTEHNAPDLCMMVLCNDDLVIRNRGGSA